MEIERLSYEFTKEGKPQTPCPHIKGVFVRSLNCVLCFFYTGEEGSKVLCSYSKKSSLKEVTFKVIMNEKTFPVFQEAIEGLDLNWVKEAKKMKYEPFLFFTKGSLGSCSNYSTFQSATYKEITFSKLLKKIKRELKNETNS